ncbi:MAG TPA: hypothetical protein VMV69_24675 [Pirellulales bacterium]|nr:hypothetical protein [Pirellulales bacterium]
MLVADGTVSEDLPEWQNLYRHLNGSAHSATVDRMTNGLRFIFTLLASGPPTMAERKAYDQLPPPIKSLLVDYVRTIVAICWDGSRCLRLAVWAGERFTIAKRMLDRFKPKEVRSYRRWVASGQAIGHAT